MPCYIKTMKKYIVLKDEDSEVEFANPKCRSMTGHSYKNYVLKNSKNHYDFFMTTPQHINTRLWDPIWKKKRFMFCLNNRFIRLVSLWFFSFSQIKNIKHLSGRRNTSRNAFNSALIPFPKKQYMNVLKFWIIFLKSCVSVKRENFEFNL